ncbi:hypothetical protein [Trueperella bialowiezensis]|uniref:Uncharacterized protein n=1 Tax=Trueperella bialowiezensis TaxID=312285 RepID=A0A448PFM9_9ACTO|nr:hypothetical protein [Trueperella bialowiezensis]VEI13716.1 Uncharacterised protein [Trueperella bialowiezensis]
MTWEILAHDIAARIEQEERDELLAEADELAQAESATQLFADRIRAFAGRRIVVYLAGQGKLTGTVGTSGEGWFLLIGGTTQHIVRIAAVTRVQAANYAREAAEGIPVSLASMLRELRGSHVTITCSDGVVAGTVTDVGRDFVTVIDDAESRRGSYARQWEPVYEVDVPAYEDAVAIPFSAVSHISQTLANRR